MSKIEEELHELAAELRETRDELRVQMHLARAEIRDDWDELEKAWARVRAHLDEARHEAAEAGEDVGAAASLLGTELRQGYRRIRKALQD